MVCKMSLTSSVVAALSISVISLSFQSSFRAPNAREANHRGAGWGWVAGTDCARTTNLECPANGPIPADMPASLNGGCKRALICHAPGTVMIKYMCTPSNWLFYNNPCVITPNAVPKCMGYTDTAVVVAGVAVCRYIGAINAACGSDDTCTG